MEEHFVKVYESSDNFKVELAKTVLKDHQIESVILNHQDSSYLSFGQIELHVHESQLTAAQKLIEKIEENE